MKELDYMINKERVVEDLRLLPSELQTICRSKPIFWIHKWKHEYNSKYNTHLSVFKRRYTVLSSMYNVYREQYTLFMNRRCPKFIL